MFARLAPVAGASLALAGTLFLHPVPATAVEPGDYRTVETWQLPGTSSNILFDAADDGRLMTLDGTTVSMESSLGSRTFNALGSIGAGFSAPFGPSFLSVSPDGSRAATGNNGGNVFIFDTADPTNAQSFNLPDFDGLWTSNDELLVSNSNGVQHLDVTTGSVTTVINNFNGGSGGLVLDQDNDLLVGKGFDTAAGGTDTGWIKHFDATTWQNAVTTGTAIDFETDGTVLADLLSASGMAMDDDGNLFVGGADFFGASGDLGYAGIVDADALASALAADATLPPIDMNSPSDVLRQIPSPQSTIDNFQSPGWTFNEATGEAFLSYFNDAGVQTFIPEPGAAALLSVGALALLRRRRAA